MQSESLISENGMDCGEPCVVVRSRVTRPCKENSGYFQRESHDRCGRWRKKDTI